MSNENAGIKLKAVMKLEKYDDNVTKEDIESGKAKPLEVINSEDDLIINSEQFNNLFK